jgi:hypothetical protein
LLAVKKKRRGRREEKALNRRRASSSKSIGIGDEFADNRVRVDPAGGREAGSG